MYRGKREECMELNFKGYEMQKWNIPTDGAQRVDEKNGVLCLDVMFTPRVMVVKMSKLAYFLYFLYFSWDTKGRNITKLLSQLKKHRNPGFSRLEILLMVPKNPINHSIFQKG